MDGPFDSLVGGTFGSSQPIPAVNQPVPGVNPTLNGDTVGLVEENAVLEYVPPINPCPPL